MLTANCKLIHVATTTFRQQLVTMLSPTVLQTSNVPVHRAVQVIAAL